MKKQVKIKIVILLMAFVATLTVTFLSMYYKEVEPAVTTMKQATLPVVYMTTPGGEFINPAYGYISKVNGDDIFNGITPLGENRNVTVAIYHYGENVTKISYRVIDLENDSLLEDTDIDLKNTYNRNKNYILAVFNIKNLIEKDKQYLLEIVLATEQHDKITYYERILWSDNLDVDSKISFVKQFQRYTYDADMLSEIEEWIETDGTGDNTNYARVNIHSKAEQIGWGALGAVVEGSVTPVIIDIGSSNAQISLNYNVVTPVEGSVYDSYQVKDYYRIRQVSEEKFYLLSYEREANQLFDGSEDLQASGRINLGIKENHEIYEACADSAGNYSFFVDSAQLWCYARPNNKFTNVFSFRSAETNGFREVNSDHEIKILSVDKDGNADFMVYGYMNGGEHEGENGVSLYRYNYEENIVREAIFIPLEMTYNHMKEYVGDIAYISDDQFYVKIGTVLYSIDLISREMMIMAEGLHNGTYAVNDDGTRIAYHYDHTMENETTIRVLNLADGTEQLIHAADYGNNGKKDRIRIIGYIEDDIVFGICKAADITVVDGVNKIFPMYGIYILNTSYELVKKYEEDGIYVVAATIDGMRVNLSRMIKNEEGVWVFTTIDQLMNRKENNAKSGIYADTVTTEARKKELFLYLPSTAGRTDSVSLRYSKSVIYDENSRFEIENAGYGSDSDSDISLGTDAATGSAMDYVTGYNSGKGYLAYGYGECQGYFDNIADAVKAAAATEGMVLDLDGSCLWHRTHKSNIIVWNEAYAALEPKDFNVNLTGLSLDNVLYFISDGKFVMARCGQENYAILYEYDNNNIYYYDKAEAKLVTASREDADKLFIEWGNVFLTTK